MQYNVTWFAVARNVSILFKKMDRKIFLGQLVARLY